MPETKHLWDRLPTENDEEFKLFDLFLHRRNVTDVARLYFGEDGRATEGQIVAGRTYCQRLKKENNWEKRVAAYDRWVGRQRDQVTATMLKRSASLMARHQASIINDLYGKFKKSSKILGEKLDNELKKTDGEKDPFIGSFNMLASAGKIIISEMEKVVKQYPISDTEDQDAETQEAVDAKDKLVKLIDKRDPNKQKPADEEEVA